MNFIRYAATLKSLNNNEVLVAAGTVFNQVLLWNTTCVHHKEHHFVNNIKRFCGHEVFFENIDILYFIVRFFCIGKSKGT